MPSPPLVSFVMPVFNRANVIERALDGIIRERRENYPNIEIVVIDGGSSDGTVEILKRYGSQIDYWISERDSGAADAFNKGVKAANRFTWPKVAAQMKAVYEWVLGGGHPPDCVQKGRA